MCHVPGEPVAVEVGEERLGLACVHVTVEHSSYKIASYLLFVLHCTPCRFFSRLALTAPFAALFVAASSMPPPMHPRAARPTLPLCAPDLFTPPPSRPHSSRATLTAAATGRPTSLAATVIAPQLCCVRPRCVCAVRVSGQHLQIYYTHPVPATGESPVINNSEKCC